MGRESWHWGLTIALGVGFAWGLHRARRAEVSALRQRRLAELRPVDLRPLVSAMDATLVAIEDAVPGLEREPVRLAGRSGCSHLRAVP